MGIIEPWLLERLKAFGDTDGNETVKVIHCLNLLKSNDLLVMLGFLKVKMEQRTLKNVNTCLKANI
jgi:hypothetical protein